MKIPQALFAAVLTMLLLASLNQVFAQSTVRPGTRSLRYRIVNIGTVSSDPTHGVRGMSINNRSHVHGENNMPAPAGSIKVNGYFWDGHVQERIIPLSPAISFGRSLNDSDQCVGYSFAPGNTLHGYMWESSVTNDVYVGELNFSHANDINCDGIICGTNSKFVSGYIVSQYRPYLRDPQGNWLDLGTLGGGSGFANAMNDHNQVVGTARDANEVSRGFLWDPVSGMVDLGTLGGSSAAPSDIDNFERVVGLSANAAGDQLPFYWEAGNMTALPTLGGASGHAKGINDHGDVVGNSTDSAGVQHATYWPAGASEPLDLGALIRPGTAWDLTGASSINELGEICGTGFLGGNQRAYRLTPFLRQSRLSGAQPGIAGRTNFVFGLGFEPGSVVALAYGFALGTTPAIGCSSQSFGIHNAQVVVNTVADSDGRIEVAVDLPLGLAGLQLYSQALETASCRLSEVRGQWIR